MTQDTRSVQHAEPGTIQSGGASALAVGMTVFGLFAILTGCADVLLGPHLLVANGAALGSSVNEPWLDSQLRFLGAMWAGWGVLMVWACQDLRARGGVFVILGAVLFVGGLGRVASLVIHPGSPDLLMFFAGLEIVVAVVAILSHRLMMAAKSGPSHVPTVQDR